MFEFIIFCVFLLLIFSILIIFSMVCHKVINMTHKNCMVDLPCQEVIYQKNNKHSCSSSGHLVEGDTSEEDRFFEMQMKIKEKEQKDREIERLNQLQQEYKNFCPPGHAVRRDLPREERIRKIRQKQRKQEQDNNFIYNIHVNKSNGLAQDLTDSICDRLKLALNPRINSKVYYPVGFSPVEYIYPEVIEEETNWNITAELKSETKQKDPCKGCGAFDYTNDTCNYCGRKMF